MERIAIVNVVIVVVVVVLLLVIVVAMPRGEKGFERSDQRFPPLHFPAISLTTIQLLCRICPFIIPFYFPVGRFVRVHCRELLRPARASGKMRQRLSSKGKMAARKDRKKERIGETNGGLHAGYLHRR